MRHLVKWNEMSEWQEDIREIHNIISTSKSLPEIHDITTTSDIKYDIDQLKIYVERNQQSFERPTIDNQFDFCESAQQILDRLNALGYYVETYIKTERESTVTPGRFIMNNYKIKNPIEYGYHDNIKNTRYFAFILMDEKPRKGLKKLLPRWKKKS